MKAIDRLRYSRVTLWLQYTREGKREFAPVKYGMPYPDRADRQNGKKLKKEGTIERGKN